MQTGLLTTKESLYCFSNISTLLPTNSPQVGFLLVYGYTSYCHVYIFLILPPNIPRALAKPLFFRCTSVILFPLVLLGQGIPEAN